MNQQATLFVDSRCELGEGPFWHPLLKRLFWFDILNNTLLSAAAVLVAIGAIATFLPARRAMGGDGSQRSGENYAAQDDLGSFIAGFRQRSARRESLDGVLRAAGARPAPGDDV